MPAEAPPRRRWLPDTLFGRLVWVLAAGMLAAQFLTSSIWLGLRHTQTLETPTRVVAERFGDVLVQLSASPDGPQTLRQMTSPDFRPRLQSHGQAGEPSLDERYAPAQQLINRVLHARLPQAGLAQLTRLRLLDAQGQESAGSTLFGLDPFTVDYGLQIPLGPGRWLVVDARLSPGWQGDSGWQMLIDVLLRVYLLRVCVVVLLVLLAVRWVVDPLLRMARAAQALEQDVMGAPAMQEHGPREARQAAQAFNRMQQRIADSLRERTRFLAAVSHDLRTPITRMRLRLEMLDAGNLDGARDKLRADLASMESLIDSTLAYIKAREHQGPRQQIDLDALVRSICLDLQELGRPVDVQGRMVQPVEGYSLGLRRALENLIDNALRYGQRATVVLGGDAAWATVSVQDEGPGIAPDLLERLRQPFERGEASRNAQTGGHGLGLSIVEAIVQAHGGVLELGPRQPHGLDACIRLPRTGRGA